MLRNVIGQLVHVSIYAPYQATSGIYINHNRILPGQFGYTASVSVGRTVTEFNGNVDDITGIAIEPDD